MWETILLSNLQHKHSLLDETVFIDKYTENSFLEMNEISLEESERLKNKYQQYEDVELFGHLEKITAFRQEYGKRSLQTYWKEAMYEFPVQYTRLLPKAELLKQYKEQAQVPLVIAKTVSLFVNWMIENMTY